MRCFVFLHRVPAAACGGGVRTPGDAPGRRASTSVRGPRRRWSSTAGWTSRRGRARPRRRPSSTSEARQAPPPRHETHVRLLWDDQYLYVGANLVEPHLWATYTERDAVIYHENDFEVFLDPDGDCHDYAELEINALNTVWDLLLVKPYRDGGPALDGWDIKGLRTAVHLDGTLNDPRDTDRGWSVEIAIPWRALKECAGAGLPARRGRHLARQLLARAVAAARREGVLRQADRGRRQAADDEFGTVIGVNAEQVKRHIITHGSESEKNSLLAFTENGPALDPLGENVCPVDGIGKVAGSGAAAVANEVSFNEAREFDVPGIGFDGDLVFEERAGAGGTEGFFTEALFFRFKAAIDLGWGYS